MNTPQVAEGPYTVGEDGKIVAVDGTVVCQVWARTNGIMASDFPDLASGWAFVGERQRMEAALLASSWEMAEALEATASAIREHIVYEEMTLESASALLTLVSAALAKARGTHAQEQGEG